MCRIFGTPFLFTFFYIVIKKMNKNLEKQIFLLTFASHLKTRAFSSAGLEHLPYKQRVGGSNPSTPTGVFPRGPSGLRGFFLLQTVGCLGGAVVSTAPIFLRTHTYWLV